MAILVVTFENNFLAQRYVEETSLSWPLLVDEARETYESYGMLTASFWEVWGLKTLRAYLKAFLKGRRAPPSQGDMYQRGGDVLIDPAGIVRLHHIGAGPVDRPRAGMIVDLIRSFHASAP